MSKLNIFLFNLFCVSVSVGEYKGMGDCAYIKASTRFWVSCSVDVFLMLLRQTLSMNLELFGFQQGQTFLLFVSHTVLRL